MDGQKQLDARLIEISGKLDDLAQGSEGVLKKLSNLPSNLYQSLDEVGGKKTLPADYLKANSCGTLSPREGLSHIGGIKSFLVPDNAREVYVTFESGRMGIHFRIEEYSYCCEVPYEMMLGNKKQADSAR